MAREIRLYEAYKLIGSKDPVVLFISPTEPPTDYALNTFSAEGTKSAWLVLPKPGDLFYETVVPPWVHACRRALGWATADELPPGYYLFAGGEAQDFDAADLTKNAPINGAQAVLGAIGLFADGTKSPLFKAMIGIEYAEAAQRVIDRFKPIIEIFTDWEFVEPAPAAETEDLDWAYGLMGLERPTTMAALKKRRNEMSVGKHPDHASEAERTAATERQIRINKAYGMIKQSLGTN